MTRATPIPRPIARPGVTPCDLSTTARGQIEFSLNVLRIASPGEPVGKRLSDTGSALAHKHISALEELLASIDSRRASEGAA